MTTLDNLVAVIASAYNAEASLAATLAQTHRALELVVVDDRSTDRTSAIAMVAAAADPRVRVLTTPDDGVAREHNVSATKSHGAFLAPVDADNLWHPDKILRQLAAMKAGGLGLSFIYTRHRRIDADNRVLTTSSIQLRASSHIFLRLLLHNFIGNGSFYDIDPAHGNLVALRDPLHTRIAALEAKNTTFSQTSSSALREPDLRCVASEMRDALASSVRRSTALDLGTM